MNQTLNKTHICFQCDNPKCKFRYLSLDPKIQDSPCESCGEGTMKSVDLENTEFQDKIEL